MSNLQGDGRAPTSNAPLLADRPPPAGSGSVSAASSQYEAILGQLAEGVLITDAAGRIIFVNEAAERLHGMRMLGIGPDDYSETYHLLTVDGLPHPPHELPLARAVLYGETVEDARWIIERCDGTRVLAVGSARPVRGEDGRVLSAVLTLRDDTQRAEDEKRLREQAQTLETLYRTGETLAGVLDPQRVVQTVIDAAVNLTGAQFGAFFHNVENSAGESMMLYTLAGAERSAFEGLAMPRATAVFQPTLKGRGVIRSDDILADVRYGKSSPHFGIPKGHLPVRSYLAVPVTSRNGNPIGGVFLGHAQPAIFSERHERLMVALAGQASIAVDNARLVQDTVELNATLEARVEKRTAERDHLWNNTQDAQLILDKEGILVAASPSVERILGWTAAELIGHSVLEFVLPEDLELTALAVQQAGRESMPIVENRCRHRDGGHRWMSWVAAPEGDFIYASGRHITREKEQAEELALAQEALRQSQKMDAVGQLTGGIAHDFNNMLAVVIGSLDLMERKFGSRDAQLRRYIESANDGAQRAATLTQRLLAFSRQQPLTPQRVAPNALVAGMSELLRGALGSHIQLQTVLAEDAWHTRVDPNQLENALLNLAVNARDAMSEGGKLIIETVNAHVDGGRGAAHAGVPDGEYVLIAVWDSGMGMSSAVLDKAFDPFFTTKDVGKGTGLGLSQVYGYVKQSGGHVNIHSKPGDGTTVRLYLPRLLVDGDDVAADERQQQTLARGEADEVVLVVEDEDAVREVCVEALSLLGYQVLQADNAASALRLLESIPGIALLFTDIVMPETNGARLAEEALRLHPHLKVLFTTGYTRDAIAHDGLIDGGVHMLGKPYSVEQLANKVREVLDSDPA